MNSTATVEPEQGLPQSLGLLLLPGFSMLALFSMLEPLRLANQLLGEGRHGWCIYTSDGCPARSSCGITMPADAMAASASRADDPSCLIVVAGFDPWPQPDPRLRNWLRGLDRRGASLGAVDTGAFLLASADLLRRVPAVVHWESADALLEMFPGLTLSDNLYELRGRRFLCAGGAAVLDMMVALLQRTHGSMLAAGVAHRLMHQRGESGAIPKAPLEDDDVLRVIEIMEARIETVSNIAEIAELAKLSKRTIERKFMNILKKTPSQVYLQCRLEHSQRLLRSTDLMIREVALACGFSSMSYFCRAYKRQFGKQPGSDRRLDYSLVNSSAALGSGA